MISTILLIFFAIIYEVSSTSKFVSYIGQAGPGWGTPYSNEDFLKAIGVPGYGGGSLGYTVLNFAFWVSNSNNGGAAVNGAAYDWQNILSRITSSSLKQTLTGKTNPSADELRAGIKSLYSNGGVQIFISAFGGADHPMQNGASASVTGSALATYAKQYLYDGVDVDWEEAFNGYLGATAGGEAWLCTLTNTLRSNLNANQKITHAPQAPYFMTHLNGGTQYPNGGYNKVHNDCGNQIDWYNIQFYNQGGSTYSDYSGLFQQSIGWSSSSAVYQIMSSNGVTIPEDKIVVGKHTQGDGSTFVAGATLKSIFDQALSVGQWAGGFMTWQFYKEAWPSQSDGLSLISHVIQSNWNRSPTSPPAPTPPTTAPPPTIPPACTIRCGSDWTSANNQCGTCCTADAECGGSSCFADLSTAPCANQPTTTTTPAPTTTTTTTTAIPTAPTNVPPPTTTTTQQTCTIRCGSDWTSANNQCGTCCTADAECGGMFCFADLSTAPCANQPTTTTTHAPTTTTTTTTPAPTTTTTTTTTAIPTAPTNAPPPTTTTTQQACTIRCGANWSQANTLCGMCCTTNDQCGGTTPFCFADLSLDPCAAAPTTTTTTPSPTTTTTTTAPTTTTPAPTTTTPAPTTTTTTPAPTTTTTPSRTTTTTTPAPTTTTPAPTITTTTPSPTTTTTTPSPTITTTTPAPTITTITPSPTTTTSTTTRAPTTTTTTTTPAPTTTTTTTAPTTTTTAPTITTTSNACTIRCGANWSQANTQCGTCCTSNAGCGGATPLCYADLSLDPCRTQPTTTTTPEPTTTTTHAPTTTTTPAPTTTTTTSAPITTTTQDNGDNRSIIGVRNKAGNTEWWYTVELTNVPDNVNIEYVKMRDSDSTEWETGTYYQWDNYYSFNTYAPYNPPLSFKIKISNGQEITGNNVINSFAAAESGNVGTISYAYEVNKNNDNTSWTIYFVIGILIIGVCIIALIGGFCIYRKKQKGKGYTKNNNKRKLTEEDAMKNTVQTEMIEVEIEMNVEVEAAKPITA